MRKHGVWYNFSSRKTLSTGIFIISSAAHFLFPLPLSLGQKLEEGYLEEGRIV
jgi:hypothetical protein